MALFALLEFEDGSRAFAAQVPFRNPPPPGLLCIVRAQDGFLDPVRFRGMQEREGDPPAAERCEFVSFATKAEAARALANAEALPAARKAVLDGIAAAAAGREPWLLKLRWSLKRERLVARVAAQGRVDAKTLRERIRQELRCSAVDVRLEPTRQIAAETGGIGICGRHLCCSFGMRRPEDSAGGAARSRDASIGICNRPCCCQTFET